MSTSAVPNRPLSPMRTAVVVLVTAFALSGCSDEIEPLPADPDGAAAEGFVDPRAVQCPGQQPVVRAPLRGLGEDASLEAYLLDDETDLGEDHSGVYCLQVYLDEGNRVPVEVTLDAPDNPANYGVSQTARDAEGSEELAYFPFTVGVYEGCRPVSASLTMRNGSTVEATMQIGTGCPEE